MMIELLNEVDLPEPGFAELDFADDYLADAEESRTRFLAELAGADPSYLGAKEALRDHPDVEAILSAANIGMITDDEAMEALSSILAGWGIPGVADGFTAVSGHLRAIQGHARECQWKGCSQAAKERAGSRGPHPFHCGEHTVLAKRKADRERRRLRADPDRLRQCCREWVNSGKRGLSCPQCEKNGAELTKPIYPAGSDEAARLARNGFHVVSADDPQGWRSDWGPKEGKTAKRIRYANL